MITDGKYRRLEKALMPCMEFACLAQVRVKEDGWGLTHKKCRSTIVVIKNHFRTL